MFLAVSVVLAVLWLLGFMAFHVTTAVIHLLLIVAVGLVILHFLRSRRAA